MIAAFEPGGVENPRDKSGSHYFEHAICPPFGNNLGSAAIAAELQNQSGHDETNFRFPVRRRDHALAAGGISAARHGRGQHRCPVALGAGSGHSSTECLRRKAVGADSGPSGFISHGIGSERINSPRITSDWIIAHRISAHRIIAHRIGRREFQLAGMTQYRNG